MTRTRAGLLALLATLVAIVVAFPVDSPTARAQDVDKIATAVQKGVAFLKGANWAFMDMASGGSSATDVGVAALAGLALLESDVPKTDASVQRAYSSVKRSAATVTNVYPLCLSIMMLDRYHAPEDDALIKQLTLRLMAAQDPNGGWSYTTSVLTKDAETQWDKYFREREKLTKVEANERSGGGNFGSGMMGPDNSNTQFAVLALWLGRHNAPVKYALLRTEERFRKSQAGGGGWGYGIGIGSDAPGGGMTCAGLLALAVAHGSSLERQATFKSGSASGGGDAKEGKPAGGKAELSLDDLQKDPQVLAARGFIVNLIREARTLEHQIYFMWSLERVCVVYGWDKDNWWDWYSWGSDILVRGQKQDGSWSYEYGRSVDTSLSLLFLRRANLLGDLTKKAKFVGSDRSSALGPNKTTPPKTTGPAPGEKASDGLPSDAKELAKELITSTGSKRELIIIKLRETKGTEYTVALAESIPQLAGTDQRLARDALAKRLERLTAKSLVGYMEGTDKELQLAAARASGNKEKGQAKDIGPALVVLLDHFEDDIKDAAYEALKSLSGENFGRSATAWKAWLAK